MIEGVIVNQLTSHVDERGRLCALFRRDEAGSEQYGQVHLTTLWPGVVKAWHRHKHRRDSLVCVAGTVRLGLYDERADSPTHAELNQFFLGAHSPLRISIPPGVWFGLQALGTEQALVVVLSDQPYDPHRPDEERCDPVVNEIPFDWERRDR